MGDKLSKTSIKQLVNGEVEDDSAKERFMKWFNSFAKEARSFKLTLADLKKLLNRYFKTDKEVKELVDIVFKDAKPTLDDGVVDVRQFMVAVARRWRGDSCKHLAWILRLYDLNCDGHLSVEDTLELLRACVMTRGLEHPLPESAEELTKKLLDQMSRDSDDDRISLSSIAAVVKKNKTFMDLFTGRCGCSSTPQAASSQAAESSQAVASSQAASSQAAASSKAASSKAASSEAESSQAASSQAASSEASSSKLTLSVTALQSSAVKRRTKSSSGLTPTKKSKMVFNILNSDIKDETSLDRFIQSARNNHEQIMVFVGLLNRQAPGANSSQGDSIAQAEPSRGGSATSEPEVDPPNTAASSYPASVPTTPTGPPRSDTGSTTTTTAAASDRTPPATLPPPVPSSSGTASSLFLTPVSSVAPEVVLRKSKDKSKPATGKGKSRVRLFMELAGADAGGGAVSLKSCAGSTATSSAEDDNGDSTYFIVGRVSDDERTPSGSTPLNAGLPQVGGGSSDGASPATPSTETATSCTDAAAAALIDDASTRSAASPAEAALKDDDDDDAPSKVPRPAVCLRPEDLNLDVSSTDSSDESTTSATESAPPENSSPENAPPENAPPENVLPEQQSHATTGTLRFHAPRQPKNLSDSDTDSGSSTHETTSAEEVGSSGHHSPSSDTCGSGYYGAKSFLSEDSSESESEAPASKASAGKAKPPMPTLHENTELQTSSTESATSEVPPGEGKSTTASAEDSGSETSSTTTIAYGLPSPGDLSSPAASPETRSTETGSSEVAGPLETGSNETGSDETGSDEAGSPPVKKSKMAGSPDCAPRK